MNLKWFEMKIWKFTLQNFTIHASARQNGGQWRHFAANTNLPLSFVLFLWSDPSMCFTYFMIGHYFHCLSLQLVVCHGFQRRALWERAAIWRRWHIWLLEWWEKAGCGLPNVDGVMPNTYVIYYFIILGNRTSGFHIPKHISTDAKMLSLSILEANLWRRMWFINFGWWPFDSRWLTRPR